MLDRVQRAGSRAGSMMASPERGTGVGDGCGRDAVAPLTYDAKPGSGNPQGAQNLKDELTSKTAATIAKAMKATNEKAAMSTVAEIVCEIVPSQRSSSAR